MTQPWLTYVFNSMFRAVNPRSLRMLRIDREGMINEVKMHMTSKIWSLLDYTGELKALIFHMACPIHVKQVKVIRNEHIHWHSVTHGLSNPISSYKVLSA